MAEKKRHYEDKGKNLEFENIKYSFFNLDYLVNEIQSTGQCLHKGLMLTIVKDKKYFDSFLEHFEGNYNNAWHVSRLEVFLEDELETTEVDEVMFLDSEYRPKKMEDYHSIMLMPIQSKLYIQKENRGPELGSYICMKDHCYDDYETECC